MKKYLKIFLFLFTLFLFTNNISAANKVPYYFIDMDVEDNGDVLVRELIVVKGTYNGFLLDISLGESDNPEFDGSSESFLNSALYNGDEIKDLTIKDISIDNNTNFNFDLFNQSGTLFEKVSWASNGDKNVYTIENLYKGLSLKIYNPSTNSSKAFLIEYTITNLAIKHNDYGEIGYTVFKDGFSLDIDKFELHINLPETNDFLRGWAHGPLHGEISLKDNKQAIVKIDDLDAGLPMDFRILFSKDIIPNSSKLSNINSYDKIIEVETELADIANRDEENFKRQYHFYTVMNIIWPGGLVLILVYIYRKYDREHIAEFNSPYYRDFPSEDGPNCIEYLMAKRVSTKSLSATILMLIYKKVFKVEKIPGKKKNKEDYLFTSILKDGELSNLSTSEQELYTWLVDTVGSNKQFTLEDLKTRSKKHAEKFMKEYNKWLITANQEAHAKNYFEKVGLIKFLGIIYSLLGIYLSIMLVSVLYSPYITVFLVLLYFVSIVYIGAFTKKTKTGIEDYVKWKAFKNFLLDFGRMGEKELPEIYLWDKYLVYATVLNCADKVSKAMEVQLTNIYPDGNLPVSIGPSFTDIMILNHLSNSVISTVNNSYSTAQSIISSQNAAHSSSASGGGFGGGFSSGGGSFGGGRSGGTF